MAKNTITVKQSISEINYSVTTNEEILLTLIAERVQDLLGLDEWETDVLYLNLLICHKNICKLKLRSLSRAENNDLLHDAIGINWNLNLSNLSLGHFVLRFAA